MLYNINYLPPNNQTGLILYILTLPICLLLDTVVCHLISALTFLPFSLVNYHSKLNRYHTLYLKIFTCVFIHKNLQLLNDFQLT